METDEPITFYFAAEIEEALVSIIWHEPERCAIFKRDCDPEIHLSQPRLRIILEAIDLGFRELGCVAFPIVVQVVREFGRLEDCGGLEGLSKIFCLAQFRESRENTEAIFSHYLEMLKTYALHRQMDPPRPIYRFTGGRGTVYRNKVKRKPTDPDFTGEAIVYGRAYGVRGEMALDAEAINFRFEPKFHRKK